MSITSHIFEDYLKCPSKCWIRLNGEKGANGTYSNWVQCQNNTYRTDGLKWLIGKIYKDESVVAVAPPQPVNSKTAKWRLAVDFKVKKDNLESPINAVEIIHCKDQAQPIQIVPIRFIFTNKLTNNDKLLLAFDAFVLSESLTTEISHGKIIHGNSYTTVKIKTSAFTGQIRILIDKITSLLAGNLPPELILSRYCVECENQDNCRRIAIEKDDLSLLAGMSAKERNKLNGKGIFTITHLSCKREVIL